MSNDKDRTDQYDDTLTKFEQELRSKVMGTGPNHRGKLMYECGYAAGVAAVGKQARRATSRWRIVGLAASVFACLSLSSNLFWFNVSQNGPLGMEQQVTPSPLPTIGSISQAASNEWITELARDQQADRQSAGILRANSATLTNNLTEEFNLDFDPTPAGIQGNPLRPSDFPRFL